MANGDLDERKSIQPAWWLPNSHLQTMGLLCRGGIKIALERERLNC